MIWLLTHPTGHAVGSQNSAQDVLPQTMTARESLIRHVLTGLFALRIPPTPGGSSFMENLGTQVQERLANPQWLITLHTLHPTRNRDGTKPCGRDPISSDGFETASGSLTGDDRGGKDERVK
ncbi:hypothetical protein [Leptospirillum ferriphilum]|nr:hypothetical protein [Leptospirillum ferriphilum]OOH72900.1 hypothetical protein BOX24_05830 [Leptospirillum ferriphilum]OOH82303.1 hypothetical protein BOX30_03525 [Leptospirillum ferriphilum]